MLTLSLLPGRAVSATSTVNQRKPELITGQTEGDLDKRTEVEKVEQEERKDQQGEIELMKLLQMIITCGKSEIHSDTFVPHVSPHPHLIL